MLLTRRAKAGSARHAVVVRFEQDPRTLHQRQGLLYRAGGAGAGAAR